MTFWDFLSTDVAGVFAVLCFFAFCVWRITR